MWRVADPKRMRPRDRCDGPYTAAVIVLSLLLFSASCESVIRCPNGYEACGGHCYDTQQHTEHCGSCNHACDHGLVCYEGSCVEPCFDECSHQMCWSTSTYSECGPFDDDYCDEYGPVVECDPGGGCPCDGCAVDDEFDERCSSWAGVGVFCVDGAMVLDPVYQNDVRATQEVEGWLHDGWHLDAVVSLDDQGGVTVEIAGHSEADDDGYVVVVGLQDDPEFEGVFQDRDSSNFVEHRMPISPDTWYELEVERRADGTVTVSVDDQQIGQYVYGSPGDTVQSVSINSYGTTARVDSIELCPPSYP